MDEEIIELSSDDDFFNESPGSYRNEYNNCALDSPIPQYDAPTNIPHRMSDSEPEEKPTEISANNLSEKRNLKKKNTSKDSPEKLLAKSKTDELKAKKMHERELKKILKEIKDAEKAAKAEAVKRKKHYQPGECLKHVTIVVDKQLSAMNMMVQAMEGFPAPEVKFALEDLPVENSIKWRRLTFEGDIEEEVFLLVVWVVDELIKHIKEQTLDTKIKSIKESCPGKKIVLCIFTLDQYFRKSRIRQEKKAKQDMTGNDKIRRRKSVEYLTRCEIESTLTKIQIVNEVDYRSFNLAKELTEMLQQYTKAVAEAPYKRVRSEIDGKANFLLKGDNRECVRVDKDLNGLSQLWMKQLTQFSHITPDTSKTIALHYPTPTALFKAYEECEDNLKRELLLQDLVVKRSNAVNAAGRRLGPELSKKISWLFAPPDEGFTDILAPHTGSVLTEIKF